MKHSQRVGEKKLSELHADNLILPWQFLLGGYDKVILAIVHRAWKNSQYIDYIQYVAHPCCMLGFQWEKLRMRKSPG